MLSDFSTDHLECIRESWEAIWYHFYALDFRAGKWWLLDVLKGWIKEIYTKQVVEAILKKSFQLYEGHPMTSQSPFEKSRTKRLPHTLEKSWNIHKIAKFKAYELSLMLFAISWAWKKDHVGSILGLLRPFTSSPSTIMCIYPRLWSYFRIEQEIYQTSHWKHSDNPRKTHGHASKTPK